MTDAIGSLEDDALIRRAVAGETECFTTLIERHLGVLKKHIRSMLANSTDTDDLVQEVLIKLWLHLPSFRFESSFRAWMTSIATNEVLQCYRRQRRRGICQPLDDFVSLRSDGETPAQHAARIEREQAVRRAVQRLPARYREIVFLRYLQNHSERETARVLQVSVPAARTRLFRARQMLLESFQRSRFDVPDRFRPDAGQEKKAA